MSYDQSTHDLVMGFLTDDERFNRLPKPLQDSTADKLSAEVQTTIEDAIEYDLVWVRKLYQLHHQKCNDLDQTKMIAQRDFDTQGETDCREWCEEVDSRHPCQKGWQWLMCDETSKYFVWAVKGGSAKRSTHRRLIPIASYGRH